MTSRALESEVELLNSEVTRLRLMVQRCNVAQQELGQKVRHGHTNDGDMGGGGGGVVTTQHAPLAMPHPVRIPQPDDPVSVLPSLFSGMDGTARLFKVLLETYPWLLPADLREAQEDLERKKEASRYRKNTHSSSRNPTPRKRGSSKAAAKKRSPSTSSESSPSSEESSSSEEELPKSSSGRSKQPKAVSPRGTAIIEKATTPPMQESPRGGGGGTGGTGSVSPRSSGGLFGTGMEGVLGLGRRSPGRQSPSSSSPVMSPTSTYTPLPKANNAKKGTTGSLLNKIKHLGEDDGSSSDEEVYIPAHKRRATSAPSDDTSDKNSFVDETMKPANNEEEDEHDF